MFTVRLVAVAALSAALAACSDGPSQHPSSPPATANTAPDTAAVRKAAREYRVHYNTPISLDSTDYYYLPVSVVPLTAESRSRLSDNSYESSDYEDRRSSFEGTCYNVLFFRKSTPEEHALLPHGRFVFTEIDDNRKPDVRWPFLFYTIIKADTNGDARQNAADASALFVSDRSGHQLHQLTPDGEQLVDWRILPKTSLLLVQIRPDINHDHRFTSADGTYWLRFDLRNLAAAPVRQPTPPLARQLYQQMLDRQSRAASM